MSWAEFRAKVMCDGCDQEKSCRLFLHEGRHRFARICDDCLLSEENNGRLHKRIQRKLLDEEGRK